MAYDITKLPDYTSEQSREFMVKSILGGQTIDLLTSAGSFDPTAKGSEAIQLMDSDVFFQDGKLCGRSVLGSTRLAQEVLTVAPYKINTNLCTRDLEKKFAVEDLKSKMKGQNYDDGLFIEQIGNETSDKIKAEIEKAVWQSDKTITGQSNLKFIDGFLKVLEGKTDLVDVSNVGDNVLSKLQMAYAKMPIEVTGQEDFRIFIGQDVANQLMAIMAEKNLFHPNAQDTLFGTVAKFAVVNGLNSIGKAVFARVRNLRAGGELSEAELEKWYSRETETVNLDSRFSLGVAVVYSSEIGVLDLNEEVGE